MWRRAARVHDQLRAGQRLHQLADAAGVVEVHVRGDDEVDRRTRQAQRVERGQQARHGERGAGVDESGATAVDHQVGGVEAVAMEAGVDGPEAVAQRFDEGGQRARTSGATPPRGLLGGAERDVQARDVRARRRCPARCAAARRPSALLLPDCSIATPRRSLASSGCFRLSLAMPCWIRSMPSSYLPIDAYSVPMATRSSPVLPALASAARLASEAFARRRSC